MMYFSLCKIAQSKHHVVEQAPGDGRLIQRPLLSADGFVFNTSGRGQEQ